MQFTCSSVDENSFISIMSEMKFCKFTEFSEMKNTFTRLTDWEEMKDNKLSSWLKVIINNNNSTIVKNIQINQII